MYRWTDVLTDRWIERQANGLTERRTGWQAGRQKSVWAVGLIGSLNKWRDRKASRWAGGESERRNSVWAEGRFVSLANDQTNRHKNVGQKGRQVDRQEG